MRKIYSKDSRHQASLLKKPHVLHTDSLATYTANCNQLSQHQSLVELPACEKNTFTFHNLLLHLVSMSCTVSLIMPLITPFPFLCKELFYSLSFGYVLFDL